MTTSYPDRSAPTFIVWIHPPTTGQPVPSKVLPERILSFSYEDHEAAANKVELELDNFVLSLFDDLLWRKGNYLVVAWGYAGNLAPQRTAVIQKITGSLMMKVEALSTSILMNKFPKSNLFENMKRSDVAKAIATKNGYPASLQVIDDSGIVFESIHQAKMTDAQFMMHLAQKEGWVFYVDFDGFHFHQRRMGSKPTRSFTYYTDPGAGDIITWSVENDVTATPGAVTAKGRDPLAKTTISATANNGNTKRDALQPIAEAVDVPTGNTAFLRGTAAEAVILSNSASSDAATREAKGKYIATQQTTVLLKMTCVGDPRVGAKQIIEILNISKRLSGRYYVKVAKHKLTATDYTMDLDCRSDGTRGIGAPGKLNPPNDGTQNTKNPADPNALTPRDAVNGVTGATAITYSKGATK